jgi:TetR/AcrR family transcriptional regulator, cholesterol catabolism regulator
MPRASSKVRSRNNHHRLQPAPETRFDQRLAEILKHATEVFYEKGYEGASMRDLSRATGTSLSGLYYYFNSKERLLYLIQKHTFKTIVERLKERLENCSDPEQRIRIFIRNHLEYFLDNREAMKVLSHEDDALKNGFGQEIAAIKREYYRICVELLERFKEARGLEFKSRIAVLSLFGMMNWIYTWHKPRVDPNATELAENMANIFLQGICAAPYILKRSGAANRTRAKFGSAENLL